MLRETRGTTKETCCWGGGREEGKHGGYGGKRKKFKQKEARCQIGEKEKDTKRQSALWRIGRRKMEKNWSFCKGDLVLHWTT